MSNIQAPDIHEYSIPREAIGIECSRGGYMKRVAATDSELKKYGCGRDSVGNECCVRAFSCKICHGRFSGQAESPDMDL